MQWKYAALYVRERVLRACGIRPRPQRRYLTYPAPFPPASISSGGWSTLDLLIEIFLPGPGIQSWSAYVQEHSESEKVSCCWRAATKSEQVYPGCTPTWRPFLSGVLGKRFLRAGVEKAASRLSARAHTLWFRPRLVPSRTLRRATREILLGPRIVFVRGVCMNHRGAAISMAAEAHDLHFASHALAVVAAVFLLIGGKAGTGHIRAFLWAKHSPPLSVHPEPFCTGALGTMMPKPTQRIVAQTAGTYELNRRGLKSQCNTGWRASQFILCFQRILTQSPTGGRKARLCRWGIRTVALLAELFSD